MALEDLYPVELWSTSIMSWPLHFILSFSLYLFQGPEQGHLLSFESHHIDGFIITVLTSLPSS